jgi:cytochrome o ubiquinol oxidase subunit 1
MTFFGRLTWDAIPFDEPIPLITSLVVVAIVAALAVWISRKGWWPYLWNEYITSTDHKRIGVMYIVLALVMLVRGFADAIMMRAQQSLAIGASQG